MSSARGILLEDQPKDELRFGATEKVKNLHFKK
jgi:hypothetical protein